jgi:hypothetical protein
MQRLLAGRITLHHKKVNHAITDLYDEDRRTFLIQYPVWLVILLGLSGVVAFAVTGLFGYGENDLLSNPVFLLPWLYALQITLEVSIFRHRSLRVRRVVIVGVTLLSVVLLGVAVLNSDSLQALIWQYLHRTPTPPPIHEGGSGLRLLTNPWTYAVLNFGILGVFWLDTARRWIRRAQGQSPNPQVDLGLDDPGSQKRPELPRLEDMISGDLIAAGILTFGLGLLLSPGTITALVHGATACTVALPGNCTVLAPTTLLSSIDNVLALITLPLGLVMLGLAATLNGLGAVGGIGAAADAEQRTTGASAHRAVSQEVSLTVLKTLQSALDRRIRMAIAALALSLRNILWPVLVLISTAAIGVSAVLVESYLHDTDKTRLDALLSVGAAGLLGVLAAVLTAFAAALFLFSVRVATNTLKFLGLFGFVLLLTFWMFSLALSGFNLLLTDAGLTNKTPFLPPGLSTVLSGLALAVYSILALRRLMRSRREEAVAAPAPTDMGTPGE